jgi:hypothetical protein
MLRGLKMLSDIQQHHKGPQYLELPFQKILAWIPMHILGIDTRDAYESINQEPVPVQLD